MHSSRRRLYGTGAFSAVDITRREIEETGTDAQVQVHLDVDLHEVAPFNLRYGASYDTERGVGVILDITNRNSLGGARELGIRSRYDGQLRDVRAYINQPALTYRSETTLSRVLPRGAQSTDRAHRSVRYQSQGRLDPTAEETPNRSVWTYGYKFERSQTLTPTPTGTIEEDVTVSPLTSTLTRETRDVALDASRGAFTSQALVLFTDLAGSEAAVREVLRTVLSLFPSAGTAAEPVHRPDHPSAAGLCIGCPPGIGVGPGQPRAEDGALLRRRQRDAPRVRAEHRRPDHARALRARG